MEDETLLEKISDFVDEVNWWDKVFVILYLVVFGGIGILMKVGVIEYATTIQEFTRNINSIYTLYIAVFICISITNIVLIALFFLNKNGAGNIIKKKLKYHYDYDDYYDIEKITGSVFSGIVALIINVVLFPMFQVIYFCIIAVILFTWMMIR